MPKSWYDIHSIKIDSVKDSEEEIARKKLYKKICAHKKPYFFMYNYTSLKVEYDKYMENAEQKALSMFGVKFAELVQKENKTQQEEQFIRWTQNQIPMDNSPSVMNKLCWAVEREMDFLKDSPRNQFDYSMIKSGCRYSNFVFAEIKNLYKKYKQQISNLAKMKKSEYYIEESVIHDQWCDDAEQIKDQFAEKCVAICPNKYELCDILIDLCYRGRNNKEIVWFVCGDTIIENLLKNNNDNLYYPKKVDENGEFWCCGHQFNMEKLKVGGDDE